MVKVHKMFSIDHDVAQLLSDTQDNASAFVNKLLKDNLNPYIGKSKEWLAIEEQILNLHDQQEVLREEQRVLERSESTE